MEVMQSCIGLLAAITGVLALLTGVVFAAVPDGRQRGALLWLMVGIGARSIMQAVAVWYGAATATWVLVNLVSNVIMFGAVGNMALYLAMGQRGRGRR